MLGIAVGFRIQGWFNKGTGFGFPRGTRVQGYGVWVSQGYKSTRVRGLGFSGVQEYKGTGFGFSRVQGDPGPASAHHTAAQARAYLLLAHKGQQLPHHMPDPDPDDLDPDPDPPGPSHSYTRAYLLLAQQRQQLPHHMPLLTLTLALTLLRRRGPRAREGGGAEAQAAGLVVLASPISACRRVAGTHNTRDK